MSWGRPQARSPLGRLRPPTQASLEFAAKAGVSVALAMSLSSAIGLHDRWWAGISAIVATADTIGASMGAAVLRIAATVVGLLVGLVPVALSAHGVLASGATVLVALVVLFALSLDGGARLGAATTLIVTSAPGSNAVSTALARGANVPLGCAVAVGVGMLFVGQRAGDRLRRDLRRDVGETGALAAAALSTWDDRQAPQDLRGRLAALLASRPARAAALHDAAHEPRQHGHRLTTLTQQVESIDALVSATAALVDLATEDRSDRAPNLFAVELHGVAGALADTAEAFTAGAPDGVIRLSEAGLLTALSELDREYSAARERRALARLPDSEVVRMLSLIRAVHAAGDALGSMGA